MLPELSSQLTSIVVEMALELVNQGLLGRKVKLPEPKAFYGDHKQVRVGLCAVLWYFTALGLDKDE